MFVPLTVDDFLHRAETVFADTVAVVDEPDQPAAPVPRTTYGELARRVRAWQAGLDALGVRPGERVAVVSQNSARLLELLYASPRAAGSPCRSTSGCGADEVRYTVEHSGASVLFVDPELDEALRDVRAPHRIVLGAESEALAMRFDVAPRPWTGPDENATATINYTSGTTARPKGVQLTHRNLWMNAVTFGLHLRAWERDVVMHTLPMFHCNGWGIPYLAAGVGATQVVLRKVDGPEILRRVAEHGVTLMGGAPAVWNTVLDAARDWDGEIPGRGGCASSAPAPRPPPRTIQRVTEELGWEFLQIYGLTETAPLLTFNRARPADDALPAVERAAKLSRAGAPALGVRLRPPAPARSSPGPTSSSRATGTTRRPVPRPWRAAGSTPATAASSTTRATSRSPTGRRT